MPPKVVLFGKPACSLCARARQMLIRLQGERAFALEEVDISTELERYADYQDWIPVVTVDGREAMRGIPNELALRQALRIQSLASRCPEMSGHACQSAVPVKGNGGCWGVAV